MTSSAAVSPASSLPVSASPLLRGADLALLLVAIVWGTSYGVAKGALAYYPVLGFLAVLVASNMTHSSFWLSTENHFFILLSVLLMAAVPSRSRSTLQPSREPV